MSVIRSKPRNAWPGDTVRIMTGSHVDEHGDIWLDGTVYVPLRGGADNTRAGSPEYQTVSISGQDVTFLAPTK